MKLANSTVCHGSTDWVSSVFIFSEPCFTVYFPYWHLLLVNSAVPVEFQWVNGLFLEVHNCTKSSTTTWNHLCSEFRQHFSFPSPLLSFWTCSCSLASFCSTLTSAQRVFLLLMKHLYWRNMNSVILLHLQYACCTMKINTFYFYLFSSSTVWSLWLLKL